MRLYRGLQNPYRPERVAAGPRTATDFTDCPSTALLYAHGSRGVLVVIDIVIDIDANQTSAPVNVTQEHWLDREARRSMIWGRFDGAVTAIFSASALRTRLRREGLRNAPLSNKSTTLRAVIAQELRDRALRSQLAPRSAIVGRASSYEQPRVSSDER